MNAASAAAGTLIARQAERIGSVPGALALGCADVGVATLETGEVVTITWGRNIPPADQPWWIKHTHFRPVWISAFDGSAELVIPTETAELLQTILIR